MISSDDFEFINELDSSLDKQSVLEKHGKNSAKAFVNLIGQISRDQTVRYLLTLIDDLLTLNRENIYLFHQFGVTIGQSAWTPFLNLLSRPDQYISCQASRITARDPQTARLLNFAWPGLVLGPNLSIRDQPVFVRGSLITAKLASWGKLRFNQDENGYRWALRGRLHGGCCWFDGLWINYRDISELFYFSTASLWIHYAKMFLKTGVKWILSMLYNSI